MMQLLFTINLNNICNSFSLMYRVITELLEDKMYLLIKEITIPNPNTLIARVIPNNNNGNLNSELIIIKEFSNDDKLQNTIIYPIRNTATQNYSLSLNDHIISIRNENQKTSKDFLNIYSVKENLLLNCIEFSKLTEKILLLATKHTLKHNNINELLIDFPKLIKYFNNRIQFLSSFLSTYSIYYGKRIVLIINRIERTITVLKESLLSRKYKIMKQFRFKYKFFPFGKVCFLNENKFLLQSTHEYLKGNSFCVIDLLKFQLSFPKISELKAINNVEVDRFRKVVIFFGINQKDYRTALFYKYKEFELK